MLQWPQFNPIAISLGPVKVYWYGLMYLFSFIMIWAAARWRSRKREDWTAEQVADLIFYSALGVIVGGRVGYMLFYDLPGLIADPILLFKTWHGGMSFHGGVLGVALSFWLLSRKFKKSIFEISDFIVPMIPLGLAAGRFANFINGELWGRVTTVPWGMVFPHAGPLPRHPSQLYEFALEGVTLFIILWFYSAKPRPRMAVTGLYLLGYGVFRSFCEFFRQPDAQIGFVAFGWMTKGQLLSIPMIVLGAVMLVWAYCKHKNTATTTAFCRDGENG